MCQRVNCIVLIHCPIFNFIFLLRSFKVKSVLNCLAALEVNLKTDALHLYIVHTAAYVFLFVAFEEQQIHIFTVYSYADKSQ